MRDITRLARRTRYVCGIAMATFAILISIWPVASDDEVWIAPPYLTGGTSAPTGVNSGQAFSYTSYGQDKDTLDFGQQTQHFDDTLSEVHQITSMQPGHNVNLVSDNSMTGTRTWEAVGSAVTVSGTATFEDRWWFDDNPTPPGRNDPPSPVYTKTVKVKAPPPPFP